MPQSIAPPDMGLIQEEGSETLNLRAVFLEWETDIERQAFQDWFWEQGFDQFIGWFERNRHLIGGP